MSSTLACVAEAELAAPSDFTGSAKSNGTATLAAADVVVTDQLDATKFNLNTLTLGQIRFGNNVVDVPAGHSNFSTVFPINASMSVRIVASFDSATGLLRWTFTTIDPTTGLPPSDSTLGFLPPDTDGIVGQGYVAFSLSPKDGLAEGTQIDNKASIVFDTNTPIETPTWRNTIDRTAPQSSVQPLSATQANADFAVSWSSTDGGAGGSAYDVYVADNGGPFSLWQRKILASSATYPGVAGHQYSFYSVATDGAGNSEAGKSAAEASTTVSANGSSGGGGGGGGGCSMNSQPRSFDPTVLLLVGLSLLAIKRRTKR